MTDFARIAARLRALRGLCDPECEGRCRDCPAEAVAEAIAAIEDAASWLPASDPTALDSN